MSEWKNKRFWDKADITVVDEGFGITLDGRPVKTPQKQNLLVPTEQMARAISDEWDAQEEVVDPTSMPWTRSANSAIEKVRIQRKDVENHLAEYAASDLLCYRAAAPQELTQRQEKRWGPGMTWIEETYDAPFSTTTGVMPVVQPSESVRKLSALMTSMDDFELTGFHDLVTVSGSFMIATSVIKKRYLPEDAWSLSRLDEEWQTEQWGVDEEAEEVAALKKTAFQHAFDFFAAAQK